jgi:serine/threonine protein kinase
MASAIKWSDLNIVQTLGEGHAGTVWLAKLSRQFNNFPVGTTVAVKRYKTWVMEEAGQFERIIRELELGRRITHNNLVRTISIIKDPEGKPALVMVYYAGVTLEEYLNQARSERRSIDISTAFQILGKLASALNTLHSAGAIHRDVKPANIILADNGPVLMDLGVVSSESFPEQTTTGAFLGTIRYTAPEYLFGESYDSHIDLYSIGAIAYELFSGEVFLSKETQWARLIAEKAKNRGKPFSFNYQMLQRHSGINVAEFTKFILNHTLTEPKDRNLNLCDFSEAVQKRLWERPFYSIGNRIILAEPMVLKLGEWRHARTGHSLFVKSKENFYLFPLKAVVEDLRKRISQEDIKLIKKCLDEHYWEADILDTHIPNRYKLEDNGVIRWTQTDSSGVLFYEFHEAVRFAYQYGYLE